MTQLETHLEQLKHAPTRFVIRMDDHPGVLLGFIDDDGLFLCCNCAAEIRSRGFPLNKTARVVWDSGGYGCALCKGAAA